MLTTDTKQTSQSGNLWTVGTLTYTAGGLALLSFWLVWGDFAWAVRERSVGPAMQLMFKKFDTADWLVGLLMSALPAAIGMIFNPVISYYSDRHRGRWGRRIPYLLPAALVAAFSILGLAISPAAGELLHNYIGTYSLGRNACALLFVILFWTLFDFASAVIYALFGALVNDVVPAAVMGRLFGAWRVVSLLAGVIFNYWILGKVEAHFMEIFIAIGLTFGVGFSLMCLKVKEGEYPPSPAEPESGHRSFFHAAAGYFSDCFSKRYYLLAFAVMAVPAIVFVPVNLFSLFCAKSVDMNIDTLGKWSAIMLAFSMLVSYPIGMLADRFHPLRVGMITLALYGVVALWGGIFICDSTTFIVTHVGTGVLSGVWFSAAASLPQRLLPKDKYGEYYSAVCIVNCISQILIGPVMGLFLDFTGHTYRYIYFASSIFAALCFMAIVALYRRFMALGGPKSYVAP